MNNLTESMEITKQRVISYLKSRGLLYNSIHVINIAEEGQFPDIEVYVNNYRALSRYGPQPIPQDEIELFMTSGVWWNGSSSERQQYFKDFPFHSKKLPK